MNAAEKRRRIKRVKAHLDESPNDEVRMLSIAMAKCTLNGNAPNSWTILRHGVVLYALGALEGAKGPYYDAVAAYASRLLMQRVTPKMCKHVASRIV